MELILKHLIHEESISNEVHQITTSALECNKTLADKELQRLVEDEMRQPITYNHYYTDNIQKARQDSLKKAIQTAMKGAVDEDWNGKFHISNTPIDSEKLLASLQRRIIVNMDDQACAEALTGLNAYYKVCIAICSIFDPVADVLRLL